MDIYVQGWCLFGNSSSETTTEKALWKRHSYNFRKIHRKNLVSESLFWIKLQRHRCSKFLKTRSLQNVSGQQLLVVEMWLYLVTLGLIELYLARTRWDTYRFRNEFFLLEPWFSVIPFVFLAISSHFLNHEIEDLRLTNILKRELR